MKELKDLGKLKCVDEETGEVSYVEISTTMEVISQTETTIVLKADL